MEIPTFLNLKYVQNDGYLTSEMQLYNDELNRVLRNGLGDTGWTLPVVTQIELTSLAPTMPDGTIWYVHDTLGAYYELVIKINGALRKVTTTAYP